MQKSNLPTLSSVNLPYAQASTSLNGDGGLSLITSQVSYGELQTIAQNPCPPTAARYDDILVYRLVTNNPPIKDDFLTTKAEQPHKNFPPDEVCDSEGVSVYENENAVNKTRKRYKGLKGKSIACGRIQQNDGKVLETRSAYHITWWLETDAPHRNFSLVNNNATA